MAFSFTLNAVDPSGARQGTFVTPHGAVETPVFMPVGTQGTVKGVTRDHLRATGASMILGNTYHLALRPGEELIAKFGGLHQFIGWDKPILTDSGGFQLFSLAERTRITEHGATFRSHIDGKSFELTPERAVAIQEALGSDVAMLLDHVIGLPAPREKIVEAMERTIRWAKRAQAAKKRDDQVQFAIVQGGLEEDLRVECAMRLTELEFPGYAIGGLSVGEPPPEMYRILSRVCPQLPEKKPRYLMGVGTPIDLLEGIERGVDMFDCVMPTRNGRNALVFTDAGPVRLRNTQWRENPDPLEKHCPCPACQHSKAYLRHLFQAEEMTGPILASLHNLTYYQRITAEARQAIRAGRYAEFKAQKIAGWGGPKIVEEPGDTESLER